MSKKRKNNSFVFQQITVNELMEINNSPPNKKSLNNI